MEKNNIDYIYIIGNNQGYVKIGVSHNAEKRLHQLQTGNANKLTLLHKQEFNCPRKHLLHIEKAIHRELKCLATKCVGEWFLIDLEALDHVKNTITFYHIRYENDLTAFNPYFI